MMLLLGTRTKLGHDKNALNYQSVTVVDEGYCVSFTILGHFLHCSIHTIWWPVYDGYISF